jgi:LCP family protein required for cell wall assembly
MAEDVPPVTASAPVTSTDSDAAETGTGGESPYQRRDNCWTFLLVGKDKVGANTDSLMYLVYDVENQTVNVASIPRDTRVDTDRKGAAAKKINAAFGAGGMQALKEDVAKTLGLPVDYYIQVDVKGFVALVNAVDGIDFDIPCNMSYDDPAQDLSIHYTKGVTHLNGQQALEVCRFRDNNDGTGYYDQGRMETQRNVLKAVAKKILSWDSVTKVNEFVSIFADNVNTDLSLSNLLWFASQALSFDMENLNTMTLPAEWTSPYMYLDPEQTLEMVNQYLNPYTTDRTADQLDIVTR